MLWNFLPWNLAQLLPLGLFHVQQPNLVRARQPCLTLAREGGGAEGQLGVRIHENAVLGNENILAFAVQHLLKHFPLFLVVPQAAQLQEHEIGRAKLACLFGQPWLPAIRAETKGLACHGAGLLQGLLGQGGHPGQGSRILVSCQETTRLETCYFVNDARLIVEVLSPSTRQRDREFKRFAYQQLPGLREYLLVAQDRRQVMVYRRLPDGWEQLTYGAGETMELDSIGLALPLSQIYEDVPDDLVAGNE